MQKRACDFFMTTSFIIQLQLFFFCISGIDPKTINSTSKRERFVPVPKAELGLGYATREYTFFI